MDEHQSSLMVARRALAQHLEALSAAGVRQIGKVPPPTGNSITPPPVAVRPISAPPQAAGGQNTPPRAAAPEIASSMPRPKPVAALPGTSLITQPYPTDLPGDAASRQRLLDELNGQVRACKLCRALACTRKQTVFGVGTPTPRVVFFGEAPGADEDRLGEPFVGRAGQLLTKIIEACTWKREDVYILNVLKCRPPENRTPEPDEVANCRPFFERQLEILRPEYIVCAGGVSAQALLETTEAVGKLRGRLHRYRGSQVLVTYHPSYLLRNPAAKKYVWDDLQMLLKMMGIPIPGKNSG
ncbi:MAG: uracil-DNA glycosylase family protein [Pirellulaceae bacterium]|nr:uracil-DNA glycosylase family protein [Pirellulaceae bacterium]